MKKSIFLFLLFTSTAITMNAQDAEPTLPGNKSLPDSSESLAKLAANESGTFDYSVKDYFKRPSQFSFKFSPDGKYLTYKERDADGKSHVYAKNTETDEVTRIIEEKEELIRGYGWANNNRVYYLKDKGGNENYHLYAVDLDGANEMELTPYDDVRVEMQSMLKDQPDFMIIEMNKDNKEVFEPFKININDGKIEKLFENTDPQNPISGYDFDKEGNLRAYTKQENGIDYVIYYQKEKEGPFEAIKKITWKDAFGILKFNYNSDNRHEAYVVSNLDNDTQEIMLYDLAENKIIKKLFSNPTYDVNNISISRKRGYELDYYAYEGEKYNIVPVSDHYKKLNDTLKKQFGDQTYYITSKTDNEDKYLIYVTSDVLYGKYFLYNVTDASFKELLDLMPQLKPEDMAEMRPITFTSRDGLTLHGYLTIPNEAKNGSKVPMIVNPHGGPYGPRDSWGFNPETQLFASRGYATLQVNYRGSGGYGKNFSQAGNKQIGRKMLNDLEDGVAYVKTLDLIDDDRVAIYGASYGGLATLGSLVKTPDLYTCGIDYVGVSNLFTFFKSFPPYWKPYLAQVYAQWYDENDPADVEIMKEVSPALNCDKITKPLFIVQGANDPRVKIEESDQVVENLRARGVNVPYMVKYDEGHGFGREENRIELYKCMMGFFATHLK